ncbi:hypothetical protein OUZ56_008677 [Daphnia magna]|uniref:Uncharacterized protein n=1 Tax=Daphnia magna TaxID=35525 RepID=A0ABR0ADQ3_9CRUS|nr:hypothetical protein OUZ56_008677 [Daphnia magna]
MEGSWDSYLWRLRVWVFKEYIQNGSIKGFNSSPLDGSYCFFSYLIQVERESRKEQDKKIMGKKNNAPTAGTIASTGLRCPGVGPFQCRMTLRSDAVSQSFGSVVEPKRLGEKNK